MAAPPGAPPVTGLKATMGLELLCAATPNSHKIVLLLEELKEAYGIQYTCQGLNLFAGEQKQPWLTALNPNGKVPVLIVHDMGGLVIHESIAIMVFLLQRFDKEFKFSFNNPRDITQAVTWSTWGASEVGPTAALVTEHYRQKPGTSSYVLQKAYGEHERQLGVLNRALEGRDYLAGPENGKYSHSEINLFPFIDSVGLRGIGVELEKWPNVKAWMERIRARPAVAKMREIPFTWDWDYASFKKKMEDPEFVAQEEKLQGILRTAQEEYGYKYVAP